jgi:hypothetical protein
LLFFTFLNSVEPLFSLFFFSSQMCLFSESDCFVSLFLDDSSLRVALGDRLGGGSVPRFLPVQSLGNLRRSRGSAAVDFFSICFFMC